MRTDLDECLMNIAVVFVDLGSWAAVPSAFVVKLKLGKETQVTAGVEIYMGHRPIQGVSMVVLRPRHRTSSCRNIRIEYDIRIRSKNTFAGCLRMECTSPGRRSPCASKGLRENSNFARQEMDSRLDPRGLGPSQAVGDPASAPSQPMARARRREPSTQASMARQGTRATALCGLTGLQMF